MEKDKKSKKGTRQQAKREEKPPSKAKNQKKKVEESDDESSDNEDVQTVIPTQKKKPASLFAFAMLADDGGDDDKSSESEDSEPEPTVQKKPIIQVNQKNAKKQQPTKTGKKNQKEEEDFDAVLAEFSEKPAKQTAAAEKKGKKMKKGAKDVDEIFENLKLQEDLQNGTSEQPAHPQEQKKSPEIRADMTADELAQIYEQMNMENEEDDDDGKRKKKKGNKQQQQQKKSEKETLKSGDEESDDDDDEDGSTVKSAAQKKKEKKERQKAEKLLKAQQAKTKPPTEKTKKEGTASQEPPKKSDVQSAAKPEVEVDEDNQPSKKDKKKKKGEVKEEEKTKKSNKMVSKILEVQRLLKEEEERKRREEEEKMRKEEEEQRIREEKERLEREKKERKKQKEKERIKRLKAEGKFLTEKQKEDRKRAQQMLESYKAQGVEIPLPTDKIEAPVVPEEVPQEKLKRVVYTRKTKVKAQQQTSSGTPSVTTPTETEQKLLMPEAAKEEKPESEEDVKDNWDDSSDSDDDSQASGAQEPTDDICEKCQKNQDPNASDSSKEEDEEEEEDEDDDDDDDSSSEDEDDGKTPQERLKEKALAAIEKRKAAAEAAKSADKLRAPVICVLGHVDTGKTKILDKLRRSHVQDGEAGGITQQIGATNVPHSSLKEQIKMCKEIDLKIPGLLIIDTPGHESFSNLRTRGSSLCDIAILVVDIMHGLEPQTIESINILKQKKTPFIVALNKIDRLFGWVTNCHADIVNQLKKQKPNTKMEFDERAKHVIVQFAEQGLNARLFYENTKPREFISLVPTSATTGDGVGNLMALICELTQTMMLKRIMLSEELQATVMEVKAIAGHGTTIDVILVNGKLAVGNTIVVAGQEGPIVTQIRSLLLPPPMHEIRVKSNFESHKEVLAAQGCKIAAKDLEKAIAGLPLYVAHNPEEVEIYREELSQMLKDVLSDIKVSEKGVYVQASTLGSLESLLSFLKSSKIPFSGINIGPVHKRDVVKTMAMLEHDPLFACILAFDVKVEKDAQEMAESNNIQIFQADIIYHLFDNFTAFRKRYYQQKQEEFKHIAMFPCKVRIMPEHIFNSRDPIICGVVVEAGFVKEGTILCVPSKNFIDIGRVSSLEVNHKQVEKATKGMEVCLKIDPIPGDAPKMVGRHFEVTDELVSKISRNSIDAVKNWFRDDMDRADWQLIVELKKIFGII